MNVYFVKSHDQVGLIKIGVTADVGKRIETLQTGSPFRLSIIGSASFSSNAQARDFERQCHLAFANFRKRGEWFTPNQHIRALAHACALGANPHEQLSIARRAVAGKSSKLRAFMMYTK